MKNILTIFRRVSLLALAVTASVLLFTGGSAQAATNGRMIDDSVFDASGSMSATDIQNFLNGFPNSCLKNYTDDMPSADPTRAYFDYLGTGSAAQIIRRVADNYGINPRVLLTKLEQESSLVSGGSGCALWRQASAVGFKCYDGANLRTTVFRGTTIQTCVATDADMGVARQLSRGGWLLKWAKERANGNLNWLVPDDATYTYNGPMTQGNKKRCGTCSTIYYDGYWNGVYLESGATASLYNYTPYLNQAFDEIWEGWWGAGSTVGPNYSYQYVSQTSDRSLTNIPSGQVVVLTFVLKNTGNQTWTNIGPNPVRIAPSRPTDKSSKFYDVSWLAPWRVGTMQETTVAPGQNATFVFASQMPYVSNPTSMREDFRLVVEGVSWLPDIDTHFDFVVVPPVLNGTVTSGALPTAMTANSTQAVTATIRNDGNVSWYKTGRFPVRLGTSDPFDRRSQFDPNSWIVGTRVVAQSQSEVAPGQSATFSFSLRAPAYNGNYAESFTPLAEGLGWFSSPKLSANIVVSGGLAIQPTPVYRFYNPSQRVHFFTPDENEKLAVQRNLGFVYEGIAFYGTYTPTSLPVYRTYNPVRQTHFLTASLDERNAVVNNLGFWNENIGFYSSPTATSKPVYRLYSPSARAHFYTASAVERDQAISKFGFQSEGIGFYAF